MAQKYFAFVAAGTGGHIFPGIAVAKKIQMLAPGTDVLFFGTANRLEARLVPEAGFQISFLKAAPWKGGALLSRLLGMWAMATGLFQALRALKQRRPSCVVAVGGYVSFPVAVAARLLHVPLFLIEPNVRTGLANKIISRWAQQAFCPPGSDASRVMKCPVIESGNPVREDLKPVEIRLLARKLLVFGGSQGAKALCDASLELCKELDFRERGWQLLLQSGEGNLRAAVALQKELGIEDVSSVQAFVKDVPAFLRSGDVVMARAGAMTVAELACAGLPTIFVPFPYAADDHQRVNSQQLELAGAALMADEKSADFRNQLREHVLALMGDDSLELRQKLSRKFLAFARPQAGLEIAQKLLAEV